MNSEMHQQDKGELTSPNTSWHQALVLPASAMAWQLQGSSSREGGGRYWAGGFRGALGELASPGSALCCAARKLRTPCLQYSNSHPTALAC